MSKCRHAVFEATHIEGAGGAILEDVRGICALKREVRERRLVILAAHRAVGLSADPTDDGCPFALARDWRRCDFWESG